MIIAVISIVGCSESSGESVDFSQGLVDLPLKRTAWEIERELKSLPQPNVSFADNLITITGNKPLDSNYPTISMWSKSAPKISGGIPYIMEVEAKVEAPERQANILIGNNIIAGQGNGHIFHHWHLSNEHKVKDYQGDWSEYPCSSNVNVDSDFHTFRLEWDGTNILKYFIDGKLICTQESPIPPAFHLKAEDILTFRIFFQRYPENADNHIDLPLSDKSLSDTYKMQVRRFAVHAPKLTP